MSANTSDACNIGPRERRKRRLLGFVALTVGVATAFVLVVYGAPRWSRAIIFFPIWIGGLGLIQSREKTCIALAARGVRNMDAGEEKVEDENLVEQLRQKARAINRRALITAIAITILALAFPKS
jgi:Trk-type K+ transport system membrane component